MLHKTSALLAIFAITFPWPAAADVGIGAAVGANDATILVPVTAGKFMFEPYFRYRDQKQETTLEDSIHAPGRADIETYNIGVGIFRLREAHDRLTIYYGGRVDRISESIESTSLVTSQSPFAGPPSTSAGDTDGYTITPAAGMYYSVLDRLSIGIEIGLEYTNVEVQSTSESGSGVQRRYDSDLSGTDTRAEIMFRMFF